MHACMYVCMYMYIYTHHTRLHTHVFTHMHTNIHVIHTYNNHALVVLTFVCFWQDYPSYLYLPFQRND